MAWTCRFVVVVVVSEEKSEFFCNLLLFPVLQLQPKSHRRHQPFLDAKVVVDHFCEGSQAVGRAARIGDDLHPSVEQRVVDAHDEHRRVARGGRDHHALGSSLQVLGSPLDRGEDSGRLDDQLRAQVAPRDRRGVFFGRDRDLDAVDDERAGRGVGVDLVAREHRVDRVVLEHVGGVVRGDEGVVDGDDLGG